MLLSKLGRCRYASWILKLGQEKLEMEEELQLSIYRKIYQYDSNCGCDILLEGY